MTSNLAAVQARISSLEAQFTTRFGATRPRGTSFGAVLANQARQVPAGSMLTVATAPAPNADWVRQLPDAGKRWAGEIQLAADRHGVDPRLLASLVQQESGFDPNAVSHAGAIGLGQLMPGTAAAMGVDPRDPVQNLDGAANFLGAQLARFGRVDLALAAYNAGPARVEQAGGIPAITETQTYVVRVLDNYDRLVAATNGQGA